MNIQKTFINNSPESQIRFFSCGDDDQIVFIYDQDLQQLIIKNEGKNTLQATYMGKIEGLINKNFNCPAFCDGKIIYISHTQDMFFSDSDGLPNTSYSVKENGACMIVNDLTILETVAEGFNSYGFNFSFKNILGNSTQSAKGINELKMDWDIHTIPSMI